MEVERSGAVRRALNCVDQVQLLSVQKRREDADGAVGTGEAETTWHSEARRSWPTAMRARFQ
jgi:hypothetical protein